MKRFLDHDHYELRPSEREALWHAVRRETHGAGGFGASPRGAFRPALAVTALTAVAVLAVAWQLGSRQMMEQAPVRAPRPQIVELLPAPAPEPVTSVNVKVAEAAPPVARKAASSAEAAPSDRHQATPAAAPAGLVGRVIDRDTGEPLQYVTVLVRGTALAAVTDSLGVFRLPNLPAGAGVELAVRMLSYEPADIAMDVPADGSRVADVALGPVIAETLQAFEVEGAEYMVTVKSAVTEHNGSPENFQKYAIDSVEDALSKMAGVPMRGGELAARGGRSGDVALSLGDAVGAPRPAPPFDQTGSVTGGTTAPNGEPVELMYFQSAGVNPFVATEDDNLSTFAVDVDDASWAMARRYLAMGSLPPRDAIRVEEFVNAFDAGWPHHAADPFRIHLEGARSRFGEGYHLLRIGLVGQDIDDSERKPANLVFVIDVSGSMARESRLGTVKRALKVLLGQLREGDRVGIVVYGSNGRVVLPLTGIEESGRIAAAIEDLQTGGSTNAAEGLELAYRMARENYAAGLINRLVLCSDGVANNGFSTEAGGILDRVRQASDEGISLSTVGFGMGNYNDVLMEKLADLGDGNYSYVDSQDEADRVFRRNLTGRLQTIAREVKVQVEFDPTQVQRWRLLGYENRDVADEDFRNDKVDAGEVGAGHQVTALYEVKLAQPADPDRDPGSDSRLPDPGPAIRVGTIRLRWQAPAHDTAHAGEITEIERPILRQELAGDFAAGSPWMRVQTVVAEFAELLRGSYWSRENDLAALVPMADALAAELPGDAQVVDLARMVRQAADIAAAQDKR